VTAVDWMRIVGVFNEITIANQFHGMQTGLTFMG